MEMIKGLVFSSDHDDGYFRKRVGRGFIYLDKENKKVTEKELIQRFKDLKIPPMWKNVWICKKNGGHLQATGLDQKNRKQYLYHPLWTQYRNASKFKRMPEFGRALPLIRKTTEEHMNRRGWAKEKVLGLVVQLLNEAFIRIGNLYYKEQNQTFGLTTLRRKHLQVVGNEVCFEYKAKSGKYRKVGIKSSKLGKLVRKCSELPGHEIFRYFDDVDKKWHTIDSHDVNDYLRRITGEQFSSKDFRTWGGSVIAIEKFEEAREELIKNTRKALVPTLVKKVSEKLGNTVAICREYYIHPAIIETVEDGKLDTFSKGIHRKFPQLKEYLSDNELITLNIIETYEKAIKNSKLPNAKEKAA